MKLTIEGSATDVQKMLQAIAGSQEHENKVTVDSTGRVIPNPYPSVEKERFLTSESVKAGSGHTTAD